MCLRFTLLTYNENCNIYFTFVFVIKYKSAYFCTFNSVEHGRGKMCRGRGTCGKSQKLAYFVLNLKLL